MLKPGFFTNDSLAELPPLGRLLFQGLWCHADREGRLMERPNKLKAEILPYDHCNITAMLMQLEDRGFISRYKVGDVTYIQILTFSKHQHPHVKEPASTIPAPDEHHTGTVPAPDLPGAKTPLTLNPLTVTLNPLTSDLNPSRANDHENQVQTIGNLHPKNAHLGGKNLPQAQEHAIMEAIIRHGYELVMAGTRNLADAVAKWDKTEKKFIPNPVRFYADSGYLQDPVMWERDPKGKSDREREAFLARYK